MTWIALNSINGGRCSTAGHTKEVHAKGKVRIGGRSRLLQEKGGGSTSRSRLRPAIFSFAFPFARTYLDRRTEPPLRRRREPDPVGGEPSILSSPSRIRAADIRVPTNCGVLTSPAAEGSVVTVQPSATHPAGPGRLFARASIGKIVYAMGLLGFVMLAYGPALGLLRKFEGHAISCARSRHRDGDHPAGRRDGQSGFLHPKYRRSRCRDLRDRERLQLHDGGGTAAEDTGRRAAKPVVPHHDKSEGSRGLGFPAKLGCSSFQPASPPVVVRIHVELEKLAPVASASPVGR